MKQTFPRPRSTGGRSHGPVWRACVGLGLAALQLALGAPAQAQSNERGAYLMPYTRYEADVAARSGSAQVQQTTNFDISSTASEASEQKFVNLPSTGSGVEWTVNTAGNGVTVRYTMPDSADGEGLNGSIDVYVNGQLDQTVPITSHYAWQYFINKEPENTPHPFSGTDYIAMRFDETHFLLKHAVNPGDKIKIQKNTNDGLAYGIDFIELEPVPAPLPKPAGYVSITEYGATPDDNGSDLGAFNKAVAAAAAAKTGVYLPPGRWNFDDKVLLNTSNIGIKGAGMWYTQVYYSNPKKFSGGILARASNVEISDIYFDTINNRRFAAPGDYMIYKAFMGTYGANSKFHHVWAEHFEVGAWLGGYDAPLPVDVTSNLLISYARFRNNYADGINFSQGTTNSTVEQTNIRNSGDDGLAMWPSNSPAVPNEVNNTFRYSTVEHVFRAGGVAIFGGQDHKVHNLKIRDCFGGSGIRFTTDFAGYTFSEQGLYRISDLDITNCGTSFDLWHQKRGAIEVFAPQGFRNAQFDNIKITNAQRHGIQLYGNFTNVTFNNVTIDGTGKDASVRDTAANSYGGVGIYAEANGGSVTFNNASITNFEDAASVNQLPGFNLIISNSTIPLKGLTLSSGNLALLNGDTQSLSVNFNPPQATNKNVTWTSSDASVVAVSAGGSGSATITAKKVGSAVITAKAADGGYTASVTVNVTTAVSIAAVSSSAVEGGAVGSFKISAPQIGGQVNIGYTVSGSAGSERYSASPALSGSVTLDANHTEQVIAITAVDDKVYQGNQNLTLTLQPGNGYQLSKATTATVTVVDNEAPSCTAPAIGYVSTAPVIDGQVDTLWTTVPANTIDNLTFGSRPAGFAGKWRGLATTNALYVLVEVTDSNLQNDSGGNWWEDDTVEVFIDGDNSKKSSYDHANDFQLGFRMGDLSVHAGGNSVSNLNGIVQSQMRTSTGYLIEAAIPWSTIGTQPQIGSRIGFDVSIDGDSDGGARDSQVTWNAKTGTGWADPSVFGSPVITTCSGTNSGGGDTGGGNGGGNNGGGNGGGNNGGGNGSGNNATSYRIVNRWKNAYLCDGGDVVVYSASSSGTSCQWAKEDVGNGRIELRNIATGDYMNIESQTGKVQATPRNAGWDSSKWVLETVDVTYSRIRNVWQSSQYIHVENQLGAAQSSGIYSGAWSSQWTFEAVR